MFKDLKIRFGDFLRGLSTASLYKRQPIPVSKKAVWKYNHDKANYWMNNILTLHVVPLVVPFVVSDEELNSLRYRLSMFMKSDDKIWFSQDIDSKVVLDDTKYNAAIIYGNPKYNEGGYCLVLTPEGRRVSTHCLFLDNFNLSAV